MPVMPLRYRTKGRSSAFASAIAVVAFVSFATAATSRSASGLAPPGWAHGGSPLSPASQVAADARYARGDCAENTLLVFRIRGSGEVPGAPTNDKLGAWTGAAGNAAIAKRWRVRDMQADYSPPNFPLGRLARGVLLGGGLGVWNALRPYRDVATRSWRGIKAALVSAYERCPKRKIMIAGYSMGALVLRYVVPNLPGYVRAQIVSIDLVGDPTADRRADAGLSHPGGRLSDGMDTWSGRIIHAGRFAQTVYPSDVAGKTSEYCLPNDYVCDFNPVSVLRAGRKAHENYEWPTIGRHAAEQLQFWPSSAEGPSATVARRYAARTYRVVPSVGKIHFSLTEHRSSVLAADGSTITAFAIFSSVNGLAVNSTWAVMFFRNSKFLGWASSHDTRFLSLEPPTVDAIRVQYSVYEPSDPTCCPSSRKTISYRWNGARIVADGNPPNGGDLLRLE